ncbi:MAG TPA: hypothetical protein VIJ42_09190, partial [Stellaceae bacterium]
MGLSESWIVISLLDSIHRRTSPAFERVKDSQFYWDVILFAGAEGVAMCGGARVLQANRSRLSWDLVD